MIDFMIFMVIYVNIKMLYVEIKTKLRILLKLRIEVRPFFLQTGIFSQNRLQTELLFSIMRYENHPKKGTGPAEKCVYFTAPACRSSLRKEKSAQTSMVSDRFRNRYLYAPLGAVGRPRQRLQQLFCVAREGIFDRRAKTNLPMCLRRCESSSLGRFAEQLFTCLHLSAAEVPCETAPFASFSGRTEKEGPARPERGLMSFSLVKAIEKGRRNAEIL